jgi:large subunit ribosomal protein L4
MKLDVKSLDGKKAGAIDLDPAIFGVKEIRADILQRMVKWQLAKRRAGTHKTLSRGEVARSHSKQFPQKGRGTARHGSFNAPIFRGGGHAHNRLPRDYTIGMPKKVRAMALRHALSAKAGADELIILDTLKVKEAKTKALRAQLQKLGAENALIIGGAELDLNFALAARNIPNIDVLPSAGLNVYDILRRRRLVLTTEAVAAINARFGAASAPAPKRAAKKAAQPQAEAGAGQ